MITIALALAAAVRGHDWRAYVNVLHRYRVCYPADLLSPGPEAPNSDGREFKGSDGAKMLVFGRYDPERRSVSAVADEDAADLAGRRGKTTYRAQASGWAVRSGKTDAGLVFYERTIGKNGDVAIMELVTPASRSPDYAAITARVSSCFARTS